MSAIATVASPPLSCLLGVDYATNKETNVEEISTTVTLIKDIQQSSATNGVPFLHIDHSPSPIIINIDHIQSLVLFSPALSSDSINCNISQQQSSTETTSSFAGGSGRITLRNGDRFSFRTTKYDDLRSLFTFLTPLLTGATTDLCSGKTGSPMDVPSLIPSSPSTAKLAAGLMQLFHPVITQTDQQLRAVMESQSILIAEIDRLHRSLSQFTGAEYDGLPTGESGSGISSNSEISAASITSRLVTTRRKVVTVSKTLATINHRLQNIEKHVMGSVRLKSLREKAIQQQQQGWCSDQPSTTGHPVGSQQTPGEGKIDHVESAESIPHRQ